MERALPMGSSVVVTGASSGIGRATALHLDRRGWRVFAGVRCERDADALQREASEQLTPLLLDVTDAAAIGAAARRVAGSCGSTGLHGLVNNAGISLPGVLEFLPLDELRRQLDVNVVGTLAVTQAFLPLLRGATGRVVNVGSMAGYLGYPFLGPYAASKFALEALTDTLRRELRPWGIAVVAVQPGTTASRIWEKGERYQQDQRARMPAAALALYGDAIAAMTRSVGFFSRHAMSSERVARTIARALESRRPRARYRVGIDARLAYALVRGLPARWGDAILARMLRLPRAGAAARARAPGRAVTESEDLGPSA